MHTFQDILFLMTKFWSEQGCIVHQGYDLEMGAGTFNPATFLRCLGPEPYKAAYVEPSRRPTDGRYGENPNRLQHYFQYQVILKPSPENIQELFLQSLEAIGFDLSKHDLRFVQDDWESPTLGASGLGWEVWMDGMEVTQFTYFQNAGGQQLHPVTGEITYGIERLAMYLQGVSSVYDLKWNDEVSYGDLYRRSEKEFSRYNFEESDPSLWLDLFESSEKEAKKLADKGLALPAYDFVMKASHAFNMLDARGVISVTERTGYIGRVRHLACLAAQSYIRSREEQGFPLCKKISSPKVEYSKEESPFPLSLLNADKTKKGDFLLEIGSEEIPAKYVLKALASLENLVKQLLEKERIDYLAIKKFATARRLTLQIEGLAFFTEEAKEKKRGPPVSAAFDAQGSPLPPAEGFFRSLGLPSLSLSELESDKEPRLSAEEVKGVKYLFANSLLPSSSSAKILSAHLPEIISRIEFPKKMRWGSYSLNYARPLRWIVCLLEDEVIPFSLGPVTSGNTTYGHKQLAGNAPIKIESPSLYLSLLEKHYVMADYNRRKEKIEQLLNEEANLQNASISNKEKLLADVLHLSEWPQVQPCSFDKTYLSVPKEVLISEMVEHQYYFPLLDEEGGLLPSFLVIVDNNPSKTIQTGNERAITPRFADGQALYAEDLKTSLEDFLEKQKQITFQKELGSLYEKTERVVQTSEKLCQALEIGEKEKVCQAARYAKCDLASKMVFEFPDLQGTMGRYFALNQGKDPEVASAIEEHWMPLGEEGDLPATATGLIVSLADKFDNIVGCYSCGLKPTSSSDPYALRRQALAIIRMTLQNKLRFSLKDVLSFCIDSYSDSVVKEKQSLVKEICFFFQNRIKTVFKGFGLSPDEIESALSHEADDIYDSYLRLEALKAFKQTGAFEDLYRVYRRAKGQSQEFSKTAINPSLLIEKAEKTLYEEMKKSAPLYEEALSCSNYAKAYALLAELHPLLASLFDEVKILAEEMGVRKNRVALLQEVFDRFEKLLDFSKVKPR